MPGVTCLDLEGLLEAWINHWVKLHDTRLSYYDYTGGVGTDRTKKEKKLFDKRFGDRIPQLTLIDDSEGEASTGDFRTGKEIKVPPKNLIVFDDKTIALFKGKGHIQGERERGKLTYNETLTKTRTLKTDLTIKANVSLTAGLEVPGGGLKATASLGTALHDGVSTQTQKMKNIGLELSPISGSHVSVLQEHFVGYEREHSVSMTGHVIVCCKHKVDLTTEERKSFEATHEKDAGKHRKWAISIGHIFHDLAKHSEGLELSDTLKSALKTLSLPSKDEKQTIRFRFQSTQQETETFSIDNAQLKAEVKQHVDTLIGELHEMVQKHHQEALMIDRLFYPPIPLQEHYVHLSVIQRSAYQAEVARLEQQHRGHSPGIDESRDSYTRLLGHTSDTLSLKEILPPSNSQHWHVLLTGVAGVGKTVLSTRYLPHCCAKDTKDPFFEWVFCLPIRRLNQENYPPRSEEEAPYTLVEIITEECFPESVFSEMKTLNHALKTLWYAYLDRLLTPSTDPASAPRVFIVLDGFDEKKKLPPYLESLFRELISLPFVLVTSRPYNLYGLETQYHFSPDITAEVTGFSSENVKTYITDFFNTLPRPSPNKADTLKQLIQQEPFLHGTCRIPVSLEMICMAWDQQTFQAETTTLGELYQSMLSALCARYLDKYEVFDIRNFTEQDRYTHCRVNLGALEHFAFKTLAHQTLFHKLEETQVYLGKDSEDFISGQKRFGFIKPSNVSGEFDGASLYYFNHLTLRDFSMARYMVACLQSDKVPPLKRVSPYEHRWDHDDYPSVTEYIRANKLDESHEFVWWFMAGILSVYKDTETLERFFNVLFEPPHDLLHHYDMLLVLRCWDEAKGHEVLSANAQKIFFDVLTKWIRLMITDCSGVFDEENKWEHLALSRSVLKDSRITGLFVELIQDKALTARILRKIIRCLERLKLYGGNVRIFDALLAGLGRLSLAQFPKVGPPLINTLYEEVSSWCDRDKRIHKHLITLLRDEKTISVAQQVGTLGVLSNVLSRVLSSALYSDEAFLHFEEMWPEIQGEQSLQLIHQMVENSTGKESAPVQVAALTGLFLVLGSTLSSKAVFAHFEKVWSTIKGGQSLQVIQQMTENLTGKESDPIRVAALMGLSSTLFRALSSDVALARFEKVWSEIKGEQSLRRICQIAENSIGKETEPVQAVALRCLSRVLFQVLGSLMDNALFRDEALVCFWKKWSELKGEQSLQVICQKAEQATGKKGSSVQVAALMGLSSTLSRVLYSALFGFSGALDSDAALERFRKVWATMEGRENLQELCQKAEQATGKEGSSVQVAALTGVARVLSRVLYSALFGFSSALDSDEALARFWSVWAMIEGGQTLRMMRQLAENVAGKESQPAQIAALMGLSRVLFSSLSNTKIFARFEKVWSEVKGAESVHLLCQLAMHTSLAIQQEAFIQVIPIFHVKKAWEKQRLPKESIETLKEFLTQSNVVMKCIAASTLLSIDIRVSDSFYQACLSVFLTPIDDNPDNRKLLWCLVKTLDEYENSRRALNKKSPFSLLLQGYFKGYPPKGISEKQFSKVVAELNKEHLNIDALKVLLAKISSASLLNQYVSLPEKPYARRHLLTVIIPRFLQYNKPVYLEDEKLFYYDDKQYKGIALGQLTHEQVQNDFNCAFRLLTKQNIPQFDRAGFLGIATIKAGASKQEKKDPDIQIETKKQNEQLQEQVELLKKELEETRKAQEENDKLRQKLKELEGQQKHRSGIYSYCNKRTFFAVTLGVVAIGVGVGAKMLLDDTNGDHTNFFNPS